MSWQSRVTRLGLRRRSSCWHFSTATAPAGARNIGIGQGGRLSVRLPKAAALVRITTAWTDKCDIVVSRVPVASISLGDFNDEPPGVDSCDKSTLASNSVKIDVDEDLQHVSVTADEDEAGEQSAYLIQAVVPEMFSLDSLTAHGNVNVINKLKGDCHIHVSEGDINLGVVRGESTKLVSGCGRVIAKELEGNVAVAATEVDAKLVNGAQVCINTTGIGSSVTVGGLYSPAAQITSEGNVSVSTCHGQIRVSTTGAAGAVSLSSVNGVAQVSTDEGDVSVHLEALEKGTCSAVRSDSGNIVVSMSSNVTADIDLEGKLGALPAEFKGDVQEDKAHGKMVGASMGQPLCTSAEKDSGSGKINLVGAREQSLGNFTTGKDAQSTVLPKLNLYSAKGSVALEIVSWIENATRRFNLAYEGPEPK